MKYYHYESADYYTKKQCIDQIKGYFKLKSKAATNHFNKMIENGELAELEY